MTPASPDPLPTIAALVALGTLALLVARALHRRGADRPGGARRGVLRGLLAVAACALALATLEAAAFRFHVGSDNLNRTLASRRWFERYWHPINSLGFRDVEHLPGSLEGRSRLYVLGDSFTAGQGVDDPERRFPDVLRRELGERWSVVNVSRCGWNTHNELEALPGVVARLAAPPDVVVLGYFLNDIVERSYFEGRAEPMSAGLEPRLSDAGAAAWLRQHSYLFDFVYWRLLRGDDLAALGADHWQALEAAFADASVWGRHRAELEQLAARCRAWHARLVVLVFPFLSDIPRSRPLTAQVAAVFRAQGATVVDLGERLAGRDPAGLVVSARDHHPNAALHGEIAAMLQEALAADGGR